MNSFTCLHAQKVEDAERQRSALLCLRDSLLSRTGARGVAALSFHRDLVVERRALLSQKLHHPKTFVRALTVMLSSIMNV